MVFWWGGIMGRLTALLDRIRPLPGFVLALFLSTVVGFLDYGLSDEIAVSPYYVLPVILASWCAGRRAVWGISLFDVVVWQLSNHLSSGASFDVLVFLWNTGSRMAFFVFVGLLLVAMKELLTREKALSRCDPLTQLHNRRSWEEELQRHALEMNRKEGRLAVIALDLDHFKAINDTLGHAEGDALLASLAGVFRETCRPGTVVARTGGDEFLVLLPDAARTETMAFLRRVGSRAFEVFAQHRWETGMSFGVSLYQGKFPDWPTLVRGADQNLYRAKSLGRGRVVFDDGVELLENPSQR